MHEYLKEVQDYLRSTIPAGTGIEVEHINVYGKGADHNDLMQVRPDKWLLPHDGAISLGFEGISVHFEMERHGYLVLHCEPYPRIGKKAEKPLALMKSLLELKGRITQRLRERFQRMPTGPLRFDMDRCRKDPCAASGNKVLGFKLGLRLEHTAAQDGPLVAEVIQHYSKVIDEVTAEFH